VAITDQKLVTMPLRPASQRTFSRLKWRVLGGAMFCYLFYYTGRQTFGFAIPGLEHDLGLDKTTLGAVSGAMLWSYAAGQIINGNLADKLGGRKLMTVGAVLSTILNWCTSFAFSANTLAVCWSANGFAQAMGWPSGARVIANWWGPRERGTSLGWYTFAGGLASVVAFITSTIVVDTLKLNWQWIFRIPVLLMVLGGVAFYLIARENPRAAGVIPPTSHPDPSDPIADSAQKTTAPRWFARYKTVLRNPKIWSIGGAIGFQSAARYGLLTWVPVYYLGSNWQHSGKTLAVWISVALPVGMAIGALVNGHISDRLFKSRRDRPIIMFALFGAISTMTMYLGHLGLVGGTVVLFLAGFFVYGPHSSFWALCPDIAGPRMAGTATGVVDFFAYLFAGAAEPVIGRLMDRTGDTSLIFPVVAGSCLCCAVVASTIRR
jgi:MFS transporter, OPA family, glycerol-3-phosphate transporter